MSPGVPRAFLLWLKAVSSGDWLSLVDSPLTADSLVAAEMLTECKTLEATRSDLLRQFERNRD